ncbi:uncharacterized protein PAC_00008 [Phialocephala subalpina]|uniref:UDP-galactose transporter n=1 Tax=Phialocephala subalpina TaxID=576137 RepID=A0A1L7WBH3_9HELO|nr:uncharacterized protein PAC_00008 [Phialocephala subalpina]
MFTLTSSAFLLTTYIVCETVRANYAYYAFHNYPQISASVVTILAEAVKLMVAATFLFTRRSKESTLYTIFETLRKTETSSTIDTLLQYATPAGLYLLNNLIYYTVLPHTTPSILAVCMLMKLPATAILHHFMIKKQGNIHAWISLLFLCVGLIIFNVPSRSSGAGVVHWATAPITGLVIACISALASISTETMTKLGDFWASQIFLYAFGLLFAIASWPLVALISASTTKASATTSQESDPLPVLLLFVILTAGTGFVVAAVLRVKDNILKIVGTAASLITVAFSQYLFLPELRPTTFTTWKVCGGGIVCLATWTYNFYTRKSWPVTRYLPVANDDEVVSGEEIFPSSNEASAGLEDKVGGEKIEVGFFVPDATKVLASLIVIAFSTMEMGLVGGGE